MKKENLYYAVFALLVIIFCAITAMRVFAATLHVGRPEKKKHSGVRISLISAYKMNEAAKRCCSLRGRNTIVAL